MSGARIVNRRAVRNGGPLLILDPGVPLTSFSGREPRSPSGVRPASTFATTYHLSGIENCWLSSMGCVPSAVGGGPTPWTTTTSAATAHSVAVSASEVYSVGRVTLSSEGGGMTQKRSCVRRLTFKRHRPRNKDWFIWGVRNHWFTRPYRPWTSRRRRP